MLVSSTNIIKYHVLCAELCAVPAAVPFILCLTSHKLLLVQHLSVPFRWKIDFSISRLCAAQTTVEIFA